MVEERMSGRPEPLYHVAEWVLRPTVQPWFRWHIEGMEHIPAHGPLLVAANHVSYFDPLVAALAIDNAGRRPRFLAKSELFDSPFLRPLLEGTGQIKVERGSGSTAPVDQALAALRDGQVVVVYPESTITRNADFSPMQGKTGIARLALASEVPVMPFAVWGTQPVWQRGGKYSLKFGRPIWAKAGAPIDLSNVAESKDDPSTLRAVTDRIMDEIGALVADLRARYPKAWLP
jgi:1-acyl-sn-glycerol-3-phosphate acyltransferase